LCKYWHCIQHNNVCIIILCGLWWWWRWWWWLIDWLIDWLMMMMMMMMMTIDDDDDDWLIDWLMMVMWWWWWWHNVSSSPSDRCHCQLSVGFIAESCIVVHIGSFLHVSQKNEPTLARCSFDKLGLILLILGKQHQHTFKKRYAYSTFLVPSVLLTFFAATEITWNNVFSSLDCWASFRLVSSKWRPFTVTHALNRFLHWPTASSMTFCFNKVLSSYSLAHWCRVISAPAIWKQMQ